MQWAINQQQYTIYMYGKILIPMHKLLKTNLKKQWWCALEIYCMVTRIYLYLWKLSTEKIIFGHFLVNEYVVILASNFGNLLGFTLSC